MSNWYTSAAPLVLKEGEHHLPEVHLQVEPGTGNVQIQFLRSDGTTWFTPANPDYTIAAEDVVQLERRNAPPTRILATGNAKFAFFGDI